MVEHCNLRCTACCNMSRYLAEKTLSVAATAAMCRTMATHLEVDVFKIMGGEPLLHPDITGVVRAIRGTGISRTIRLFTNGLLLHSMGDAFWEALDELTISNYASAPVKPAMLAQVQAKAREHDVVLNVKPVGEFSEVMRDVRVDADDEVRQTYEQCWLRHRCMVVRDNHFYMCTRAAYADDYHTRIQHGVYPEKIRNGQIIKIKILTGINIMIGNKDNLVGRVGTLEIKEVGIFRKNSFNSLKKHLIRI